jgi:hypothetical protein
VVFSASGARGVAGTQVTVTGIGSCTITASQPGDATFAPAPGEQRSFNITAALPPQRTSYIVSVPAVQVNRQP